MKNIVETLSCVAGYEEEKIEAIKMVDILKNFGKYKAQGAYIPKGLVLSGVPGVGKTLLAKAIAGESQVPLYEFAYQEEDLENVVIKNLKETFKKAKEKVPSIVLIDEMDEVISTDNFVSDFSRKILKIILTEIEGTNSSDGVLTIITKNINSRLPSSLIRSGRMDKHIQIDIPNLSSRKSIFEMYLKNKNCSTDISSDILAQKTNGFTGADIKTLINETLLLSISLKNESMRMEDFDKVIPTILFKDIERHNSIDDITSVAYHELGHFISAYQLKGEITSISLERYGGVKGFVKSENNEDQKMMPASKINDEIIIDLAGMAAEEIFLHDNYLQSSQDIISAKRKIKALSSNGVLGFKCIHVPSFLDINKNESTILEYVTKETAILEQCYNNAKEIILQNKAIIEYIYPFVYKERKISKVQLDELIQEFKKSIIKE